MCNSTSIINSNTTIITIAISSCLTIIGWGVVSLFSSIRDENNRKKDIQTKYLVEAYRDIGIFNTRENHNAITMEVYEKYERAIRDIQIYGSLKEIELVNDY
jgi:ABC-type bacteriocin/lantibiotic exporter with double-glycine peptidase domain